MLLKRVPLIFTYIHVLPDVVLLPEECAGYCYFLPDVSNIPIILGDIGAYVNEAALFFCFTISDCRPRLASLLRFTFITLHFVAFSFSTLALLSWTEDFVDYSRTMSSVNSRSSRW